ncbi:MAG: PIN domain-containing protein [Caulobacteraceae bacterium]
MIAADTSSFINFLRKAPGRDSAAVRDAIKAETLWLPPPVKTELLSGWLHGTGAEALIANAPLLTISPGYWERAGASRRLLVEKGLKARLADTLIAQCCIDADVKLIARDGDFRHFARWCGLKLAA